MPNGTAHVAETNAVTSFTSDTKPIVRIRETNVYLLWYKNPNGQLYLRASYWDQHAAYERACREHLLMTCSEIVVDKTGE